MQSPETMFTPNETGYLIPNSHGEEIHDMCREFIAELIENCVSNEMTYQYGLEPEEIENLSRSGFWAWTEGGWKSCLCQSIDHDIGTGNAPAPIQSIIDANTNDIARYWYENKYNNLQEQWEELKEPYELHNAIYEWIGEQPNKDKLLESFWEYENEYWSESGVYFWKMNAIYYDAGNSDNETGEPEVYFDAYINTDLDYGRDYISWLPLVAGGGKADQTHGQWKKVVKVSDITPELIAKLASEAFNSLQSI